MQREELERKMLRVHNLTQAAASKEKERDGVRGYGETHNKARVLMESATEAELAAMRAMILTRLEAELTALLDEAEALLK